MKVRALANQSIFEKPDDEARAWIASGLYEAVDEPKSTKVEPLTTRDFPKKKGK